MAEDKPIIAEATNVVDLRDGKRVTVEVRTLNVDMIENLELFRDNRARARAMIAAGFAEEGFIRNLNLRLQAPEIDRRTEIIDKEKIDDDLWSYTIKVRSGIVLG